MHVTRRLLAVLAALTAFAGASAPAAVAAYPNSMSALGDSITRAFNTCSLPFTDCVANSWSTGTDSTVKSHYSRILAANAKIRGKNYNRAVSGAKADDTPAQADAAVADNAEYVTLLIGANDACTSSESTMTSTASFQSSIQATIDKLKAGLPNAKIFVGSVPDVYKLWKLFYTNSTAVRTWNTYDICQSMLANATSLAQEDEDRRQRVRQRVIDFNTILRNVCGAYANCKYDGDALFNYEFVPTDVSTRDYFHPSKSGQKTLAEKSWAVTWTF